MYTRYSEVCGCIGVCVVLDWGNFTSPLVEQAMKMSVPTAWKPSGRPGPTYLRRGHDGRVCASPNVRGVSLGPKFMDMDRCTALVTRAQTSRTPE